MYVTSVSDEADLQLFQTGHFLINLFFLPVGLQVFCIVLSHEMLELLFFSALQATLHDYACMVSMATEPLYS